MSGIGTEDESGREDRHAPTDSISISIPGHGSVRQWADERLWLAYRGTSRTPYVIQCALMALESWLLAICNNATDDVDGLLLPILQKSNNVMTTAVLASVCNAYPGLCRRTAFALLKSRKCIELDAARAAREPEAGQLASMSNMFMKHTFYSDERGESNSLPHRRHNLEALAHKLQSSGNAEQVLQVIRRASGRGSPRSVTGRC